MIPRLITADHHSKSAAPRLRAYSSRVSGARVALQTTLGCTPCVLGQMYCCEISGFPPKLECSHRSC